MFRNNASVSCFTIILLFHPILPSTLQVWYLHLFLLISYFLLSERTTCTPYGNDILNTIFTGRENIKWRHEISNFTILVKNNILINGKGSPETKGLIRSEVKMWSSFFPVPRSYLSRRMLKLFGLSPPELSVKVRDAKFWNVNLFTFILLSRQKKLKLAFQVTFLLEFSWLDILESLLFFKESEGGGGGGALIWHYSRRGGRLFREGRLLERGRLFDQIRGM